MIRPDPEDQSTVCLTVELKSGITYPQCDMPANAFGVPGCVSFWSDDKLMLISIDLVKEMYMTFGDTP